VKHLKLTNGLTLIELLVVTVIISILIITSMLDVPAILAKARDSQRKANLYRLKIAMEEYYDFANRFPSYPLPECGQPLVYNNQSILNSIPCDPLTKSNYIYVSNGSNNFQIYATLETKTDSQIADLGCTNGCGPSPVCIYNYGVSSLNINLEKCPTIVYACSPSGKQCEQYDDPKKGECPVTFTNDPTCKNMCEIPANQCKSNSGKKK